ncbi:uncharacterized protein LOC110443264 [Mizuhopecten yessoensis]|uniref:Uncharacterized protein n=1 Tax=Mizuhopecten yessoensis TaxID=6573 RepID=A0A210PFB0_MIZYE|nr:uncharacterized protein LOC110443264 [Mizuhopecten yessoensis]OWF35174.1 hypothetical protein KP79_PYT09653 [Mizuhopecten yessoensis]
MASLRRCFVFLTKTAKTGKNFTCLNGRKLCLQQSASHMTLARAELVKPSLLHRLAGTSDLSRTFTHHSHRSEDHDSPPEKLSDSSLNCRLAAENGYLSWTRNAYISCVAGCALLTHVQTESMVDAVFGILFISWMNMTCGTAVYTWNLLSMRRRVQMSGPLTFFYLTMVLLHFMIFTAAMVVNHADFDSTKIEGLKPEESELS